MNAELSYSTGKIYESAVGKHVEWKTERIEQVIANEIPAVSLIGLCGCAS